MLSIKMLLQRSSNVRDGVYSRPTIDLLLCALLFLIFCFRSLLGQYVNSGHVLFADDAYYYFVVARHLAQAGQSTFDGFTLTNGYHPLWMAVLAVQFKYFTQSLLLTRFIEFGLGLVALISSLRFVRLRNTVLNLLFTVGFYLLFSRVALNGMETALFACCLCLFVCSASHQTENVIAYGVLDGLLAAAAIASRVDAAVFVLPLLALASESRLRRSISSGVTLACGLSYMLINRVRFGVALPISGDVKSLGGLQFNYKFWHILTLPLKSSGTLFYIIIILALFSPFVRRRVQDQAVRRLLLAYMIGTAIYAIRLGFFSSWTIWSWYGYPVLLGYIGCAPFPLLAAEKKLMNIFFYRQLLTAMGVVLTIIFGYSTLRLLHGHYAEPYGFYAINRKALDQYGSALKNDRIAMGDRAGNFAYEYPGGVNQLEGLMNDREYLDVLKKQGDVKSLLCRRDIQYLVAYEPDLGRYETHHVQTIRRVLSQYQAPVIDVQYGDEVGKVFDLSTFNDHAIENNSYLYIWKLKCGKDVALAGVPRKN